MSDNPYDSAPGRPKAAYIGPAQVGDFLKKQQVEWDFYPHSADMTSFKNAVETGGFEEGLDVIFIYDGFFDPSSSSGSFERFVADYSPFCLFAIVSYTPSNQEVILERVENWRYNNSSYDGKIFFIDTARPAASVQAAVNAFMADPGDNAEQAAWTISGGAYQPQAIHDPTHAEPVSMDNVPAPANFGNNTLGQVVAVTSSKGGSGKSTMSLSLATYIAHASIASVAEGLEARPLKVVVLDLDVRDSQVGFFTGLYKPTVLQLRKDGISPETIKETAIYHEGLKLDVILGPRKPRAAEDLPPEFYVDLIQTLRGLYDYVILDTSVQYTDPLLEKVAYPIADQIIMVTEVAIPSVHSMFRWIKEVTNPPEQNGMGIPKQKIGIIVNKSLGQVHLSGKEIVENAQGIPILTAIPSNQRLIVLATNLSAIQAVLRDDSIKDAVGRAVKAIVGDKYQLSDNLQIDS